MKPFIISLNLECVPDDYPKITTELIEEFVESLYEDVAPKKQIKEMNITFSDGTLSGKYYYCRGNDVEIISMEEEE